MSGDRSNLYEESEPKEYRPIDDGSAKHAPAVQSDRWTVIKAVMLSAMLTIGILTAYDNYVAQKIVALDVKGYIAEQRDFYLSGKINDTQLKESFDRLELVKERVPKNRVIILGDVLVRKNVEEIIP